MEQWKDSRQGSVGCIELLSSSLTSADRRLVLLLERATALIPAAAKVPINRLHSSLCMNACQLSHSELVLIRASIQCLKCKCEGVGEHAAWDAVMMFDVFPLYWRTFSDFSVDHLDNFSLHFAPLCFSFALKIIIFQSSLHVSVKKED